MKVQLIFAIIILLFTLSCRKSQPIPEETCRLERSIASPFSDVGFSSPFRIMRVAYIYENNLLKIRIGSSEKYSITMIPQETIGFAFDTLIYEGNKPKSLWRYDAAQIDTNAISPNTKFIKGDIFAKYYFEYENDKVKRITKNRLLVGNELLESIQELTYTTDQKVAEIVETRYTPKSLPPRVIYETKNYKFTYNGQNIEKVTGLVTNTRDSFQIRDTLYNFQFSSLKNPFKGQFFFPDKFFPSLSENAILDCRYIEIEVNTSAPFPAYKELKRKVSMWENDGRGYPKYWTEYQQFRICPEK